MKADQLKLVLDSLAIIQPIADTIAKTFYAHLFEVVPGAQSLFTGDMDRQGAMLMTSLSLAVSGLSNTEDIQPSVQALGERHFTYGVKHEHYQPFADAFIWSLEKHLGSQFTPELKEAWTMAFQTLIETMRKTYDSLE